MQIFADALSMLPFFVGIPSPDFPEMKELAAAAIGEDPRQFRVVGQVGVEKCRQLIETKAFDLVSAGAEAIMKQAGFGRALHGEEEEGANQDLVIDHAADQIAQAMIQVI